VAGRFRRDAHLALFSGLGGAALDDGGVGQQVDAGGLTRDERARDGGPHHTQAGFPGLVASFSEPSGARIRAGPRPLLPDR